MSAVPMLTRATGKVAQRGSGANCAPRMPPIVTITPDAQIEITWQANKISKLRFLSHIRKA